MARKQNDGVQPDVVPVPKHIQDHYQKIILTINTMHVNQISFLIMASRHIHYHASSVLPSMNGGIIVLSMLHALYKFYRKHNFRITEVFADSQFVVCKHKLAALQVNLNCVSKDGYIPEVERVDSYNKGEIQMKFP